MIHSLELGRRPLSERAVRSKLVVVVDRRSDNTRLPWQRNRQLYGHVIQSVVVEHRLLPSVFRIQEVLNLLFHDVAAL